MNRAAVIAWVQAYLEAWRTGDVTAVARLFTEDARYRVSPYEASKVGQKAIEGFWLDDEGETFTAQASPVAVEDTSAVVRVLVKYGEPVRQEYLDLWVLHFADDGRVDDFEEWPYWPGAQYVARDD